MTSRSSSSSATSGGGPVTMLRCNKSPGTPQALTNNVFVSAADARTLTHSSNRANDNTYVLLDGQWVYSVRDDAKMAAGEIGLSGVQREVVYASLGQALRVEPWAVPARSGIALMHVEVGLAAAPPRGAAVAPFMLNVDVLLQRTFRATYQDGGFLGQCFTQGQRLMVDVAGTGVRLAVSSIEVADNDKVAAATAAAPLLPGQGTLGQRGVLYRGSQVMFALAPDAGSSVRLVGEGGAVASSQRSPLKPIDLAGWGIGGLDDQFQEIFRRAFASRVYSQSDIKKLGTDHVRGMLLYGPPGTGKTLMARSIGKALNGREPKVVNGPEILNKYVGQSEENIRNLFKDAEEDQKKHPNGDGDLHIIIFDEIDAICRQRGSRGDSTGVHDNIVNQLLSKIEGVESLNNILIIGMTNRRDLIDEALLRPGRLEVHIEVGLPDEAGRLQIFKIHTREMREHDKLAGDVDLSELANITKNFTGAEIKGLVNSATSFALYRNMDPKQLTKAPNFAAVKITRDDFFAALREVRPAFGASSADLDRCLAGGLIEYGDPYRDLLQRAQLLLRQLHTSRTTSLMSLLLHGDVGCGKTAIAAQLARDTNFPFIKLLSPESLVGLSESGKCGRIIKTFEDSAKSPLSVIVVDDLERIIEFVEVGMRFSNPILQTLLVCLKQQPPSEHKLLTICTSSNLRVLGDMGLLDVIHAKLKVPALHAIADLAKVLTSLRNFSAADIAEILRAIEMPKPDGVPIKTLLMLAETAAQSDDGTISERFVRLLNEHNPLWAKLA